MGIPDDDAYWRRHNGIAGRWSATPAGRRGCMILLAGGLVVLLLAVVLALVIS